MTFIIDTRFAHKQKNAIFIEIITILLSNKYTTMENKYDYNVK